MAKDPGAAHSIGDGIWRCPACREPQCGTRVPPVVLRPHPTAEPARPWPRESECLWRSCSNVRAGQAGSGVASDPPDARCDDLQREVNQ
jgi:hypothetical protein